MVNLMPPEAMSVIQLVDSYLRWKIEHGEPRGFEVYHPSAFGDCLRKMQYQRYAERGYISVQTEQFRPATVRIFDNGHSMHDRWRSYFEALNVLRGYWICTNPICGAYDSNGRHDGFTTMQDFMADPQFWYKRRRKHGVDNLHGCFRPSKCFCGWEKFKYEELDVISSELNFHGHADMILDFSSPQFDPEKYLHYATDSFVDNLPKTPVVADMKSANMTKFQSAAKGECPTNYQVQLMIYCNLLNCDYGLLIYENKNNQTTTAYRIDRSREDLWPEVVRQAKLMNQMVEVEMPDGTVNHLLPPPRPISLDSTECEYCPYRNMCKRSEVWNDPSLENKRSEFYGKLLY